VNIRERELDRFKVIQSVVEELLKPWRAAERLSLTTRQVDAWRPVCASKDRFIDDEYA
jgi:hypothetical protein